MAMNKKELAAFDAAIAKANMLAALVNVGGATRLRGFDDAYNLIATASRAWSVRFMLMLILPSKRGEVLRFLLATCVAFSRFLIPANADCLSHSRVIEAATSKALHCLQCP